MRIYLSCIALVLSGCIKPVAMPNPLNFAYSKPSSVGMYDPRATPAGTVLGWDLSSNSLTTIGEIELVPGTATASRTVTANGIAGLGVNGLEFDQVKLISTSVGRNFDATLTNSSRQNYYYPVAGLRDFVIERAVSQGMTPEDFNEMFRPKDDNFRVVVFVAEERPASATVSMKGADGSDSIASLTVTPPSAGAITVSVDLASSVSCTSIEDGERTVCFTDVEVFDPYIRENGNMSWRPVSYDQELLSDALRNR